MIKNVFISILSYSNIYKFQDQSWLATFKHKNLFYIKNVMLIKFEKNKRDISFSFLRLKIFVPTLQRETLM